MPMATVASSRALPPGRLGIPIVGESWSFVTAPREFVLRRVAEHGPIFRSHILGRPTVLMAGPEALRFVLVTHQKYFATGRGWPRGLRLLMDGALMMQDGDEHQRTRRAFASAFSTPALRSYAPAIARTVSQHLARWAAGGEFRLYDATKLLMFDIASQLLLGRPFEAEVDSLSELFEDYTRGMEGLHPILPIPVAWTPFGRALRARNKLLRHIASVLQERRDRPAKDALSLLLESGGTAGDRISDEELCRNVLFLLLAGHESSTSLVAMAVMEFCRHPDILEQARAEQATFARGELSLEAIATMEILDRVVLEIERLYPPFIGAFRHVIKSFEFAGYHVPAGSQIFYCIAGTHHLDGVHADPMRFDPTRFVRAQDKTARQTCALAGFGGGGHVCLGRDLARLETKIVLALLLRAYDVTLAPDQSLEMTFMPSIRPKSGLRARLVSHASNCSIGAEHVAARQ